MKQLRSHQLAFTLLEVMVALVIFSICALVLMQQSARSIRQNDLINDRLKALWIAENALQQLRLDRKFPTLGHASTEQIHSAQSWIIERDITATSRPDFRKVRIIITKKETSNSSPFEVIAYMGRY